MWMLIGTEVENLPVAVRSFLETWPMSTARFESAGEMVQGASVTEPVNVMVP